MRKLILLCASLCSMALFFAASPVRAQNVLWVASNGSDGNNCGQTTPCATFQGAINKGSVSQINCLTSGNYGVVTITASLTIDCGTGNVGTVSVTGATNNAITINSSSAATIVLRHLSLSGNNSAQFGISGASSFASGTLVVEDCTIQGFTGGSGIVFGPSTGRGLLQVSDSRIFNNGFGIFVTPSNNQIASVTLNRVELTGNSIDGLDLRGSGVVVGTMRVSVAGGNGANGVFAGATQVFFTVEESSIATNLGAGIQTNSAGSVVNVAASTIGGNGTGVLPTSGSLISFGDNHMSANGANGNFTSTKALR
jgi:hypothetical protein